MEENYRAEASQLVLTPNFANASCDDLRTLMELMNIVIVVSSEQKQDVEWLKKVSRLERSGALTVVEESITEPLR